MGNNKNFTSQLAGLTQKQLQPAELFISTTAEPAAAANNTIPAAESKTRRVQLLMQPSLYEDIKKAAAAAGLSVNEFIHQTLKESIKRR